MNLGNRQYLNRVDYFPQSQLLIELETLKEAFTDTIKYISDRNLALSFETNRLRQIMEQYQSKIHFLSNSIHGFQRKIAAISHQHSHSLKENLIYKAEIQRLDRKCRENQGNKCLLESSPKNSNSYVESKEDIIHQVYEEVAEVMKGKIRKFVVEMKAIQFSQQIQTKLDDFLCELIHVYPSREKNDKNHYRSHQIIQHENTPHQSIPKKVGSFVNTWRKSECICNHIDDGEILRLLALKNSIESERTTPNRKQKSHQNMSAKSQIKNCIYPCLSNTIEDD